MHHTVFYITYVSTYQIGQQHNENPHLKGQLSQRTFRNQLPLILHCSDFTRENSDGFFWKLQLKAKAPNMLVILINLHERTEAENTISLLTEL